MTEYPTCTREGCDNIAKSDGLCSMHYMARYRAQTRDLEEEEAAVRAKHGEPSEYVCDGADGCSAIPTLWYCKDGVIDDALALCPEHIDTTIVALRLNLRRLGAKK